MGAEVTRIVFKANAADAFLLTDDEGKELIWSALAESQADPIKAVCAADEDSSLFTEVRPSCNQ